MDKYAKGSASARLQIPISDKTVTTELSGDFVLPDYQPEIKRLLRVSASVLPPSKYIGDRQAEFAGNIDYYVLYIGSDNAPYCAPLTAEYKIDMPLDADMGESDGYLQSLGGSAAIQPDMISGRVTAPRKLSIKCRLKSRIQIFGEMPLEDGYTHGEDGLQVLRGKVSATECLRGAGELLRVSDEMICDSRDGELRVISAEGRVLMSEVTSTRDAIVCRGDLYVKLLLCREEDGTPYTAIRKMPLSQTVAVEGVNTGDSASAKGSVCELNVTVDEGRIGIESGVIIEAQAAHSEDVEYVKDVYSVSRRSENGYKTVTVPRAAVCFGGNFTLSDSLSLEESGLAPGARVIDASGTATVEEYSLEGGKCAISGKAKFALLTEKDGEYGISEAELPFSYRTSASGDFSRANCECEIISARARADGERVGIDAEIGVMGMAMTDSAERMLSGAAFGDEISAPRGEFVVCYPSDDDTLWSVAKRYGASLDALRESNRISDDASPDSLESLQNVPFLVI